MLTQGKFRSFFEVAGQRLYFNHAAYSPLSRPVVQTINKYFDVRMQGSPESWNVAVGHMDGLRKNYASLIASPVDRIAMMANTVSGISVLANGIEWKSGDHILLYSDEFPANVMPFLNLRDQGVIVEFLDAPDGKVSPELFEAAIRPETRLISVSTVQYLTGYRADVKAISDLCHAHHIIFAVDAIQSLGIVPTDVVELGIDFLAAGGHKWMMSPLGTGFLYLTEALQAELKVTNRGYMGNEKPDDYGNFNQELTSDARRFEMGAFNAPGMAGAETAVGMLLECGVDKVFLHVRNLIKQMKWGIKELPFEPMYEFAENESSGIFMFSHEDASRNESIYMKLVASNVNVSLRGGGIRFAPHYYNSMDEIEQLLNLLDKLS